MATPFASMLDSLTRQRGVTAALVVSERDGIVVDSNLQIGQDGDRVAALAASLYRKARLSAQAAGMGAVAFMQLEAPGGRLCSSSTRLFHAPHAGHWPAHLVWTAPQDWQA